MPNEPMTLVERLQNPQWVREPNEPRHLDIERTVRDMALAGELLHEVIENAPGDDPERFIRLPHTLAELGWFLRVKELLGNKS